MRDVTTARAVDMGVTAGGAAASVPTLARARRDRIRTPAAPSRAGVSVIAMSTAIATLIPPTVPMRPRNGMPVTLRANRAMMTVEPAKTTALPAVPFASAIESATSTPCNSCLRCR